MSAQRGRVFLAGIIALYIVLAGAASMTTLPWTDEAYQANPSLDILVRGTVGNSVVEPTALGNRPGVKFTGYDRYNYMWMPYPFFIHAAWYKVFGCSVYSMRSVSMLFGVLLLLAGWSIVRSLTGDETVALLAAALMAVDRMIVDSGSSGRPDMIAGGFCLAGLAAHLYLREKNLNRAILIGQSLMALGVFSHPASATAFAAFCFLMLYLDRSRIRWHHFLLAGIPHLVAIAGWGLYILQEPSSFWPQFSANLRGRSSGMSNPLIAFEKEIRIRFMELSYLPPYATGFSRARILIPFGYFAAAALAYLTPDVRRNAASRTLLFLLTFCFVFMTFYEGLKSYYYLIHILPYFIFVLAAVVHWYWIHRPRARWLLACCLGVMVALQVGWTLLLVRRDSYHTSYLPVARFVKERMGPRSIVMAPSEFGFELGFFGGLIEDPTLGYTTGKVADLVIVDERGFQQVHNGYRDTAPRIYQHVTETLSNRYTKIYDQKPYKVYARNGSAP